MTNARKQQVGGDHYKSEIQPIDYIHANNLDFFEGSVLKYITRHKNKGGEEDIKKAIHYLELILEYHYKPLEFTDLKKHYRAYTVEQVTVDHHFKIDRDDLAMDAILVVEGDITDQVVGSRLKYGNKDVFIVEDCSLEMRAESMRQ